MSCWILNLAIVTIFLSNVQCLFNRSPNPQGSDVNFFVVNGRNASWGEAFYQASLRIFAKEGTSKDVACGAVLIEYHVVLTAAQCVYYQK